jgi:hypothetical protein
MVISNCSGVGALPSPRTVELYLHSPIHLHGIVLNYINKYTATLHKYSWNKDLLVKITVVQLVNEFFNLFGARKMTRVL